MYTPRVENGRTRARAAVAAAKRRPPRRSSDESDEESSGTDDAPPGPEPAPREWGAPWASSSDSSQYVGSARLRRLRASAPSDLAGVCSADRSRRSGGKRSASAGGARRRAARAKRRRQAPASIAGLDLLHSTTLASTLQNGAVSYTLCSFLLLDLCDVCERE